MLDVIWFAETAITKTRVSGTNMTGNRDLHRDIKIDKDRQKTYNIV